MIKLAEELEAAGYKDDPERFKELIADLKDQMYRTWTEEELIFHTKDSNQFCNMVRLRTGLEMLPDHIVLRTLVNMRKAQYRPRTKKSRQS